MAPADAAPTIRLTSIITCPVCGYEATERMPTDACQFFYDCRGCGTLLRPKERDCCVFCSYGSVPCPPIQEARAGGTAAACCGPAMADRGDIRSAARPRDWAGDWRGLAGLWGVPGGIMLAAWLVAAPAPRAAIWVAMLVWMGAACIANARRCGRTHCRFTGPFFLSMAGLVAAYAAGTLPIGSAGWAILGAATFLGNAVLWWGSERAWGAFSRSPGASRAGRVSR